MYRLSSSHHVAQHIRGPQEPEGLQRGSEFKLASISHVSIDLSNHACHVHTLPVLTSAVSLMESQTAPPLFSTEHVEPPIDGVSAHKTVPAS